MTETDREIEERMMRGSEFTFSALHSGLPEEAYRMADRKLQSFRKRGFAVVERRGRQFVWSLTEAGREHILLNTTERR